MTLLASPFATENWSENRLSRNNAVWTATRGWLVTGVSNNAQAVAATGTTEGQGHPQNPLMTLKYYDDEPKGPYARHIVAHYTMEQVGANAAPLSIPPKLFARPTLTSTQVDRDALGNPVTNSAGDPPSSRPSDDVVGVFYDYERNEPFFSVSTILTYMGAVNSDTFTVPGLGTFYPGQCKMQFVGPVEKGFAGSQFVPMKYTWEFRPGLAQDADGYWDGFKYRFQDVGRRSWGVDTTGNTAIGELVDVTHEPIGSDVPLNGIGQPMPVNGMANYYNVKLSGTYATPVIVGAMSLGTVIIDNSNPNAVFLKWRIPKSAAFGALNF